MATHPKSLCRLFVSVILERKPAKESGVDVRLSGGTSTPIHSFLLSSF